MRDKRKCRSATGKKTQNTARIALKHEKLGALLRVQALQYVHKHRESMSQVQHHSLKPTYPQR